MFWGDLRLNIGFQYIWFEKYIIKSNKLAENIRIFVQIQVFAPEKGSSSIVNLVLNY